MFEKALKTVKVELKDELLWDDTREFLIQLWLKIRVELGDIQWTQDKFLERINQEVESRRIDLRKFRNERGEPITNMFKRIIRDLAKESNIQLSNDSLSRLLNYIREQYATEGVLTGALYPVEAFFKREEYGIPDYYETGDDDSCFRDEKCNYGSSLWLKIEDEKFDRAKFIVFHYQSGNKEGWGRCWLYTVSPYAIFATNFYSYGFAIKSKWLKYPVVRVLRLLAGLTEKVRFAYGMNISLPIYLNRDGVIIYEKDQYSNSDEVIEEARAIQSECMECGVSVKINDLYRSDIEWKYGDEKVQGLIVCDYCRDKIKNSTICAGCNERYHIYDMYRYNDEYFCEECFRERFESCCICDKFDLRENMIVDRYGNCLCQDCADEHRRQCEVCGEYVYKEEVDVYEVLTYSGIEEKYVCNKCEKDLIKMKCEQCGYEFFL